MALGKRKPVQQPLFVSAADLNARSHPFYEAVNAVLASHHFDTFVEDRCARFYDDGSRGGRPGLAPGIYFRCLLVGYFEGIDSERGIDWRCNDSHSLKLFLGVALDKPAPDHSTISRTRRLIDVETHREVFQEILKVLANHGPAPRQDHRGGRHHAGGQRRDAIHRAARHRRGLSGVPGQAGQGERHRNAHARDLAKLDKKRKNKASNDDWESPTIPMRRSPR